MAVFTVSFTMSYCFEKFALGGFCDLYPRNMEEQNEGCAWVFDALQKRMRRLFSRGSVSTYQKWKYGRWHWFSQASVSPKSSEHMSLHVRSCLLFSGGTEGVLLAEYLPSNWSVNKETYCETLFKLQAAIKRKQPGKLSRGIILIHDNTCPHVVALTRSFTEDFSWYVFPHPANFHVFECFF